MKNFAINIIILTLIFTVSAEQILNEKMIAPLITAKEPNSNTWKSAPKYEFMKKVSFIEDFRVLPVERATVQLAQSATHIFVNANMIDSDVVTECNADSARLNGVGDTLHIFLMPKGQNFYWEIQCAPNNITKCFFFPGGGWTTLPSVNVPLKNVAIKSKITINGKINDFTAKDSSWQANLAIPLEQLFAQVSAQGIKIAKPWNLKIMVGRVNFSNFLDKSESSGYPQPVKNYQCFSLYADIVAK